MGIVCCFSHIKIEVVDFCEEDHRGESVILLHHIKGMYYYYGLSLLRLSLVSWLRLSWLNISTVKYSYPLFYAVQIIPTLAINSFFSWFLCHFDMSLSLHLCIFLALSYIWNCTILQTHLAYLCPIANTSSFSQESWFFLLEVLSTFPMRNQKLIIRCSYCYRSVISSRCFQLREKGTIYMYTNLCICIYPFFYVQPSVSKVKWVHFLWF